MQPAGVSPTSNEPFTGKTVGDYVLRERVGKGTFGSVYRATKSDGTVVAIKIISRAGMLDHNKQPTRLMDQFNKEVDIMRIINHPKIIKFRDPSVHMSVYIICKGIVNNKCLSGRNFSQKTTITWSLM